MTTHCSAKLVPPSMTVSISSISGIYHYNKLTVLAVELSSNNEFVGRKLLFDGIHNLEDEAATIL